MRNPALAEIVRFGGSKPDFKFPGKWDMWHDPSNAVIVCYSCTNTILHWFSEVFWDSPSPCMQYMNCFTQTASMQNLARALVKPTTQQSKHMRTYGQNPQANKLRTWWAQQASCEGIYPETEASLHWKRQGNGKDTDTYNVYYKLLNQYINHIFGNQSLDQAIASQKRWTNANPTGLLFAAFYPVQTMVHHGSPPQGHSRLETFRSSTKKEARLASPTWSKRWCPYLKIK